MSTELSNGVIIPEEYSDDWYDEMSINLRKLNDVITAASDNATDIQRLDTDKANQSDLTALTSRVSQNETDIIALQTAVSGALKREIVQTLPTEDISTTTIYMIRNSQSSGTNIYDEYMYINNLWELIGTSATDFSNYYTKNETDNLLSGKVDNSTLGSYYTKTESDNLLSAKANQTDLTALSGRVTQNETDITALQTAVSGALKREIVQSLPTQDISTTTIYMIRNTTTSGDNIYDEYMYINNLWELIGTSATDFSNYYTKTEIDTLLSYKATDSDVVHKSGDETIGGKKTFSENITFSSNSDAKSIICKTPLSTYDSTNTVGDNTKIRFLDKNNNSISYIMQRKLTNGSTDICLNISNTDSNNQPIEATLNFILDSANDPRLSPGIDNTISVGRPTFRYKSFYGMNYYYGSNNVEFSTKFVTTDTAQTISGNKTFSNNVNIYNSDTSASTPNFTLRSSKSAIGTSDTDVQAIFFSDKNGVSLARVKAQNFTSNGATYLLNSVNTKDTNDQIIEASTSLYILNNGRKVFRANADNDIFLGYSLQKWKDFYTYLINGLTPSSLGMPVIDRTKYVDISGYFTNTGNGDINTYSVTANGWVYLRLTNIGGCQLSVLDSSNNRLYGSTSSGNLEQLCLPVTAGTVVETQWTTSTSVTVAIARFIPCQGNI